MSGRGTILRTSKRTVLVCLTDLTAVGNHHSDTRGSGFTTHLLNGRHDVLPRNYSTKSVPLEQSTIREPGRSFSVDGVGECYDVHDVLPIQPRRFGRAQKELRAIGVGPRVSHGQNTQTSVLENEILVFELGAVNALAPGPVLPREVAL